jgi:hypothetical protein
MKLRFGQPICLVSFPLVLRLAVAFQGIDLGIQGYVVGPNAFVRILFVANRNI